MTRIMVCILNDKQWSEKAIRSACKLARNTRTDLILVKMIPVQHVQWLNSEAGYMDFSYEDMDMVEDCARCAVDYDVSVSFVPFQYYELSGAIADAAELVKAQTIFATLPGKSYWHKFQLQRLERKLQKQGRLLYTLETPVNTPDWIPLATASK